MNTNKITIKERDFFYQELVQVDAGDNEYKYTIFYQDTYVEKYKKYLFFGPIIEKTQPKTLFSVPYHITDPNITKNELRTYLERKVELLNRKEEIAKGELI